MISLFFVLAFAFTQFYFHLMYRYLYLLIFFTSVFIPDKVLIILSGTLETLDSAEPPCAV